MPPTYEEVLTQLTGEGGPFELVTEIVRGLPMRNFKHRERSVREKIAHSAARGDACFLVYGDRRITYAQHARLVWGTAHNLEKTFAAKRGDRVAVLAYNSPEWLISVFGATSIGAIGVPLNGWWQTEELAYGLLDSGSRFLVVDERLYPRVEPVLRSAPALETVFYVGASAPAGTVPIEELIAEHDEVPTNAIDEDDPFVILYTSGTTGRAKGCITTHRGTIEQVLGIIYAGVSASMMGGGSIVPEGDQVASLVTSPLFHVGGFHSGVCTSITAGVKIVMLQGKFDPDRVMALIERERVSMWPAIPTMLHRVVHSPNIHEYDLSSLRSVSFGGAPTPPETIDKAREVLRIEPSFTNVYGLTETHGVATANAGKELLGRKTSAGRPIPCMDCKVVDEAGRRVPPRTLGEILFYGPLVTPGYWGRPDATAETVRDGWLHTGDIGYFDDEGFLYVVDRAKDMILRGGENVYCVEIENCLADHPLIDEAAVIGVADPELGERVKAVVRLVPGSSLSEEEIKTHVASHLASFKVPELVAFTNDPLPRNAAGKLMKNELRTSFG